MFKKYNKLVLNSFIIILDRYNIMIIPFGYVRKKLIDMG